MLASVNGKLDIAKMLVGLKPDVNAANKVSLKRRKEEKKGRRLRKRCQSLMKED
jgi:hypothetical protein